MLTRAAALDLLDLEIAIAEAEQREALEPAYDWYGPDCGCPQEKRRPHGACPEHPRARPSQRPPEGRWKVWYLECGRGFGKTLTGAKWVIDLAQKHGRGVRIALVAPTAKDIREVMVDGETGILNVSPPWFTPKYEPTKSRLTWPNGAIAVCYSAEEPDRLRGPQHHFAWCLAGHTPVLMADGTEKPIRDVRAGEMVATRVGPRRVTNSLMTKRKAEVFRVDILGGRSIIGTGDHEVFVVGRGFVPIRLLSEGMAVCVNDASSGAGRPGIRVGAATTRSGRGCTGRSGRRRTGRSRPATTSTTRTVTSRTTASKTSISSPTASTVPSTSRRSSDPTAQGPWSPPIARSGATGSGGRSGPSSASSAAGPITAATRRRRGSARPPASRRPVRARSGASRGDASSAGWLTRPRSGCNGTAPSVATTSPRTLAARAASSARFPARSAASPSGASGRTPGSAAIPAPSVSTRTIASVARLGTRLDVYDISVEGAHEFFAAGILVHNCDEVATWDGPATYDMLMFGLRLGSDPRCVMTTTPKPWKWLRAIKAKVNTVLTRGSSHENTDNITESYYSDIIAPYEGTKQGRREIQAIDEDDAEGALWTSAVLDECRMPIAEMPEMDRVIVAVDPSAGDPDANPEAEIAECGIVVVGVAMLEHPVIGWCGTAYLLADATIRAHPAVWGRRVIDAYASWKADVVVAEVNNGGAMVETVLRGIDPNVGYKQLHASRGKRTRAEPVASLYQQGRVFHARGVDFGELESQLTTWVPGRPSPDRLDALVWGVTEAVLEGGGVSYYVPNPFAGYRGMDA